MRTKTAVAEMKTPNTLKTLTILKTLAMMMTLIAVSAMPVVAQGPGGKGHRPPKPAIDTILDANSNGIIDAEEINTSYSTIVELDKNDDGQLSFQECMGLPSESGQQRPPEENREGSGRQHPAPPIFTALDTNGDKILDDSEINDAPSALLKLDINGDGSLSRDECRPARPDGPQGGGKERR